MDHGGPQFDLWTAESEVSMLPRVSSPNSFSKNTDSLRNLTNYPKLIKLYPYLYGFPGGARASNDGLRRVFDDVVAELTDMSNQKKSEKIEIEKINKDLLKISMNKIIFNFVKSKNVLGIFYFGI
jgi:hypothetical protein